MAIALPTRSLTLVTPSYGRDFDLCKDLVDSVLRYTQEDVVHHIIVPKSDLTTFRKLSGKRTIISDVRTHLPESMIRIPGINAWLNLHRPFPPVRGWMAQQIIKLAAAASMESNVVLLIDSDVLLIRPINASSFARSGRVQLFESEAGIDGSLPRHHLWHSAARRLLGLAPYHSDILPDYICWPCAWHPHTVRKMLERIELVTGLPWATAVGQELHFSEMILYGVYVREVVGVTDNLILTNDMHCLNYSDEIALNHDQLRALVENASPDDIAIMISAKSGTPLSVRRRLISDYGHR